MYIAAPVEHPACAYPQARTHNLSMHVRTRTLVQYIVCVQAGAGWSSSGAANGSTAGSPSASSSGGGGAASDPMALLFNANLLADRNKAFELFRKSYRQNEVRVHRPPS